MKWMRHGLARTGCSGTPSSARTISNCSIEATRPTWATSSPRETSRPSFVGCAHFAMRASPTWRSVSWLWAPIAPGASNRATGPWPSSRRSVPSSDRLAADLYRSPIVVDDDLAARRNRLAGQDPSLRDLVGTQDVVGPHPDLPLSEEGHAGPAVSRLAVERRLESHASGGFEDGVAGLVRDGVPAAVEPDHDRLRLGCLARRQSLGGQLEPLDEEPICIYSSLLQTGTDDLHIRAGAANVEVGLRPVPDQRGARRGVQEPIFRVEVMMHRKAAAEPRAEAFER